MPSSGNQNRNVFICPALGPSPQPQAPRLDWKQGPGWWLGRTGTDPLMVVPCAPPSERPTPSMLRSVLGSLRAVIPLPKAPPRPVRTCVSLRLLSTAPPFPPAHASTSSRRAPRPQWTAVGPGLVSGTGLSSSKQTLLLRCTIVDAHGRSRVVSGDFLKAALCAEHGLEVRDLRKIDSRVPNVVPTILARRGAFLVNMLHIRALVKHNTVLLFDGYGSSNSQLHNAFVLDLEHNLRTTTQNNESPSPSIYGELPYEFRALESILASVLEALHIELEGVRQLVLELLVMLDQQIDRDKLRTLLACRRKVGDLLSHARGVKGAVAEVLESDEDMALMHLSDAAQGHPRTPESLAWQYDALELMLESFDKQLEEVISYTDQMQDTIGSSQEIVELLLDSNRNQLLAMELRTSMLTMGATAATLIAACFGMNLTSGLEEDAHAFLAVCAVASVVAGAVCLAGIRRIRNIQRVGLGKTAVGPSRSTRPLASASASVMTPPPHP